MSSINQAAGGCGCPGPPGDVCDCSPCPIPKANLTLSTGGVTVGTLVWDDPNCRWILISGANTYTMTCDASGTTMTWETFDSFEAMTFVDSTCEPLHLHFHSILVGPAEYYVDFP